MNSTPTPEERLSRVAERLATIILATFLTVCAATEHILFTIWGGLCVIFVGLLLILRDLILVFPKRKFVIYALGLGIIVILALASFQLSKLTISKKEAEELKKPEGQLIPANESAPPFFGNIVMHGDATNVTGYKADLILGSCRVEAAQPSPIGIVRYFKANLVALSVTESGAYISGSFYGTNGNIVALLESNRFTLNQNNAFKPKRPDRSTLIVEDQQHVEVLNIRFLNPHTFRLKGVIRLPNSSEVIITDDEIHYTGKNIILCGIKCVESSNVMTITDKRLIMGDAPLE